MKLIELKKCPECLNFTIMIHPMASTESDRVFNYMVKCNFCGYTALENKHKENIKNKFQRGVYEKI